MYYVLRTKKSLQKTEVIYKLDGAVDPDFLAKLSELGNSKIHHFHGFRRKAKPEFKIVNQERGVHISGNVGDDFLYCTINGNSLEVQRAIESKLIHFNRS